MSTSQRATGAKNSPQNTSLNSRARANPQNSNETKPKDAIAILRSDHTLVSGLFAEYEKTRSVAKKKSLVSKICTELTLHALVEEEIFYPAVKAALRDKQLVPEATVEHASLKDLIAQVEGKDPDGEMFDAKIKVMAEYVKHHVKEEQNEMFPKAKSTKLDMFELGERILARKDELKLDMEPRIEKPKSSVSLKDKVGLTT